MTTSSCLDVNTIGNERYVARAQQQVILLLCLTGARSIYQFSAVFDHVSVVSQDLGDYLKLSINCCLVLGYEFLKEFGSFSLLLDGIINYQVTSRYFLELRRIWAGLRIEGGHIVF
jgi:hypothetical protein